MKTFKTIKIPESQKQVLEATFCDICKNKICDHLCEIDEVIVSHSVGTCYPEGGYKENWSYDICKKCFCSKIMPFLKTLGAEPTYTEIDW